jgi:hypothetical protein
MAVHDEQPRPAPAPNILPVTIGTMKTDVQLLPGMSVRVARLHVYDQIGRALKGPALTEALKALGCK